MDLFRCESATLRTHWVLVVMDQYTRSILGLGVHAGTVDGVALCRMFNRAIRGQRWLPKYVGSDNDPLYKFHQGQANLRVLEVTQIKSIPYLPLSHPFVERLIRTLRREYLAHMLFCTTADLENKLLFQELLQQPSHAYLAGRANAGCARGPTSSQSPLVSMATTLSSPLSDTDGCLIWQRLALAAVSVRHRQNFQEIIQCFPSAEHFADPTRSFHCHRMHSESESQLTFAGRSPAKAAPHNNSPEKPSVHSFLHQGRSRSCLCRSQSASRCVQLPSTRSNGAKPKPWPPA